MKLHSLSLGDDEARRLHELRQQYAVPVHEFATSMNPSDCYQAALRGVETTLRATGQRREMVYLASRLPENA